MKAILRLVSVLALAIATVWFWPERDAAANIYAYGWSIGCAALAVFLLLTRLFFDASDRTNVTFRRGIFSTMPIRTGYIGLPFRTLGKGSKGFEARKSAREERVEQAKRDGRL